MPIPMPDQRKQIQTPQVRPGQALNLSKEAMAATQMYANIRDNATKAVNSVADLIKQKADAEDLETSSNIYTEYMAGMYNLNAKRDSLDSTQLKAFEKEYNEEATKLYNNAINQQKTIRNKKISQNLTEKLNSFNIPNARKSFLTFDKAGRQIQEDASNRNVEMYVSWAKQMFVNSDQPGNAEKMASLFTQMDAELTSALIASGDYDVNLDKAKGLSDEERTALKNYQDDKLRFYLQAKREKAMEPILEHLNATTTDMRPWHQFDDSISLVEQMQAAGYISDEYATKKLKEFEKDQLSLELKRNPEQFWDEKTGKFYSVNKFKNVKYLNQEEYERAAKTIKETQDRNPSVSAKVGSMADAMVDKIRINDEQFREKYGLLYEEEIKEKFNRLPGEDQTNEEKDFTSSQEKRRKSANATDMISHLTTLYDIQATPVYVRMSDGEIMSHNEKGVQVVPDEELDAMAENANLSPNDPKRVYTAIYPFNNSEMDKIIKKSRSQIMSFISTTGGTDKTDFKVYADNRGFFGKIFFSKDFSTEEVVNTAMYSFFSGEVERAKEEKGQGNATVQFDSDGYIDAVKTALTHIRNGDTVLSKEVLGVTKEGMPIYGRTLSKQNVGNKFDGLQSGNKTDVYTAIYSALAETLPAERFNDFLANDELAKDLVKEMNRQQNGPQARKSLFMEDNDYSRLKTRQPSALETGLNAVRQEQLNAWRR